MKIIERKLSDLIPYENNPRNNDGAVDAVAASIKEFGFKVPIVIDKANVIIAGHTRFKASEKLKLEKVPCIVADDLTEQQIKAYRLADNKVGELADWDFGALEMELEGIDEIDMEQFGFEPLVAEDAEIVEDEVPEIPEEAKSQEGDLWILGKHRLICGDSTDATVIERLMNGHKANMVLTDPPYGVTYTGGMKIDDGKIKSNNKKQIKNDALDYENLYQFLYDVFTNIKMYSIEKTPIYVFYAHSRSREFLNAFYDAGLKQRSIIIWHKTSGGFGDFMAQYMNAYEPCIYGSNGESVNWYGATNEKTVWDMDKEKKCDLHPTMKPLELVGRAIKNSSKTDDLVLDTFGGSGSTLIACEQLNRRCNMCELDSHYVDVILKRYVDFKGNSDDVFLIDGDKKIPYREIFDE